MVWFGIAASACAIDVNENQLESEVADATCPRFGCGTNTAFGPDGLVFDEFDWSGKQGNEGGAHLGAARIGAIPVAVSAERDRLVAHDALGNRYSEMALVGMIIDVPVDGKPGVEIQVANVMVNGVQFWGGDTTQVAVYYDLKARYVGEAKFTHQICNNHALTSEPWGTAPAYSALIFEGDRYDAENKLVIPSAGENWLNIACAGSYPAKMHLLRHTAAGEQVPTTAQMRTTMLKALTADYFGDGRSFTITGQPLRYSDAASIKVESPLPFGPGLTIPEALWNEHGIVCLDEPRVYPRNKIDPDNVIPHCSIADWQDHGYVVTGTPVWLWF
ncbi:MAG: ADYC domain-containing protein [Kofleriaceae bacterium]